jgi:hypothetical protein
MVVDDLKAKIMKFVPTEVSTLLQIIAVLLFLVLVF